MATFKIKLDDIEVLYRTKETQTLALHFQNNNFKQFEMINKVIEKENFIDYGFEAKIISISEFESKLQTVRDLIGFELGKEKRVPKTKKDEYSFYDWD